MSLVGNRLFKGIGSSTQGSSSPHQQALQGNPDGMLGLVCPRSAKLGQHLQCIRPP